MSDENEVTIEWKSPPKKPERVYEIGPENLAIMDALKANRGEWALIKRDTFPSTTAWWKKLPGFEARSSRIGKTNGKWDVYARYVGKKR